MTSSARLPVRPPGVPSNFPLRSVLPLRASLLEPDCVHALYRAAWAEGICGVPSFVLTYDDGTTLRLWGQDRLVMVRAALEGWMPVDAAAL